MNAINLPTLLTLIRLIVSPLFLPLLLVYCLPLNLLWLNLVLGFIFILFGLTDFLDGYLARKYGLETRVGKVLDPIADKFLVYSTLIALLAAEKIFFYWVVLLIGREIFVMGLRQVALENNVTVAVSAVGKFKTALQMLMLTVIIMNPFQDLGTAQAPMWNGLEAGLLFVSIFLSLFSAYQYYKGFIRSIEQKNQPVHILKEHDRV